MMGWLQSLFSPEVLQNVMGQGQAAPQATLPAPTQPVPPSPGFNAAVGAPAAAPSMIEQLTRVLSHPLTQGIAGGAGSYMAAPRGSTRSQQLGRGLIGGINTMGEAQQNQRREALAQAQMKHQTDELAYRKDIDQQRLGQSERELEQRRDIAQMEAAARGFEPPEQRPVTIARLTEQAKNDPIAARVLPLMNPNSATPGKDFQEMYKNFNNLDSQEKRVEDKIQAAKEIADLKAGLEQQKLKIESEKVSAVQQAALARIQADIAKQEVLLEKARSAAEAATAKLTNTKENAFGDALTKFMQSDAYSLATPEERPALLHEAKAELAAAYGLPPPKQRTAEPAPTPAAAPGVKPPTQPVGKATVQSVLKKFGVPGY